MTKKSTVLTGLQAAILLSVPVDILLSINTKLEGDLMATASRELDQFDSALIHTALLHNNDLHSSPCSYNPVVSPLEFSCKLHPEKFLCAAKFQSECHTDH